MNHIRWSRGHHCGKHLPGCCHGVAPRSYRAGAPASCLRPRRHGYRSSSTPSGLASASGVGWGSTRHREDPEACPPPEQACSMGPERRGWRYKNAPSVYRRFCAWHGRLRRAPDGRASRRDDQLPPTRGGGWEPPGPSLPARPTALVISATVPQAMICGGVYGRRFIGSLPCEPASYAAPPAVALSSFIRQFCYSPDLLEC